MKKCTKSGKTKFKNEKDAKKAMMVIWSHDPNSNIFDMNTYLCPHCKFWHVGHRSKFGTRIRE